MNPYVVYKHTDPEGLVYIGITRKLPHKRFDYGRGYKHNARFREAIERIGWDNFTHEILREELTREEAEALEAQYIAKHQSTDPAYGYNVKTGGAHGKGITEEARRHLSEIMRGDNNPSRRFGSPMKGKKHDEATRRKMSAAARTRPSEARSAETRAKLRAVQKKKAVRDVETGAVYAGIHEAAEATGLQPTKICAVCKGKRKTTGGKRWEYVEGAPKND